MNLDTLGHMFTAALLQWTKEGYGLCGVRSVEYVAADLGQGEEVVALSVVLAPREGEAPRAFVLMDRRVPPADRGQLHRFLGVAVTDVCYVPPEERRKHG